MENFPAALQVAAQYGQQDVIKILIREGAIYQSALERAVRELLHGKFDLQSFDVTGHLPIHLAASRTHQNGLNVLGEN